MPSLHIKVGSIQKFVKRLSKDDSEFRFLKQTFSSLVEAKIKESLCVGPDIKKLICYLYSALFWKTSTEHFYWRQNFFATANLSADIREKIKLMLGCYHEMRCKMSSKLHDIYSLLSFFPENMVSQLAMNMESSFIRMALHLICVIKEDGSLLYSQITVGA